MESIITNEAREKDQLSDEWDHFNYRHLAAHLLKYICNKKWPISIGIYGRWGSGKSTLVNFLARRAKEQGLGVSIYDAVEYRDISTKLLVRKIKQDNKLALFVYYSPYILGGLFFLFALFFIQPILYIPAFILIFQKYFFEKLRSYFPVIKTIIDKHFFNSLLFKESIVIIDNVDRLLPSQAISFLEELKFVLLKGGIFFSGKIAYVIPCDFEILQGEVRSLYRNRNIDAADYLNKLIEIPFYLPSLQNDIPFFIKSLLSSEVHEVEREKIIKIFPSRSVFVDTPRDIKNYLLQLDMICLIASSRGKPDSFLKNNLASILAVQIIRSKFRPLYDFLWVNSDILSSVGDAPRYLGYHFYKAHVSPGDSISEDDFRALSPKFKSSEVSGKYDESLRLLELTGLLKGHPTTSGYLLMDSNFTQVVNIIGSASQFESVDGSIGVATIGTSTIGM